MSDFYIDFTDGPRPLTDEEQVTIIYRATAKIAVELAKELKGKIFASGDKLDFSYVVDFGPQPEIHQSGTVKVISNKGE